VNYIQIHLIFFGYFVSVIYRFEFNQSVRGGSTALVSDLVVLCWISLGLLIYRGLRNRLFIKK
jgi:hypothetical protein